MKVVAIIPARLESSRYPNKPLAKIHGRPMIEHVYKRVALAKGLTDVYIATCNKEIFEATEAFGGKAIMTRADHERGTDRIAEAADKLDLHARDIVVNVQGDEPMVQPEMLEITLKALQANPKWSSVNLLTPIDKLEDVKDPNQIKVIVGQDWTALYMSRQPIPSLYGVKSFSKGSHWKQVCIIPFWYETLKKFVALPQTQLEQYESIDMMRLIQNGIPVGLAPYYETLPYAVDTPEDLRKVESLLESDALFKKIFR